MERKINSISNFQKKKLNLHAIRVKETQFAIWKKKTQLAIERKKNSVSNLTRKEVVCLYRVV